MAVTKLGDVLKALREKQGWTLEDLTKRAKVSFVYISQLERGKRKNPSLVVLKRLARALGVPVAELLE